MVHAVRVFKELSDMIYAVGDVPGYAIKGVAYINSFFLELRYFTHATLRLGPGTGWITIIGGYWVPFGFDHISESVCFNILLMADLINYIYVTKT